jgi:hypothetical protein
MSARHEVLMGSRSIDPLIPKLGAMSYQLHSLVNVSRRKSPDNALQ